MVSPTPVTSSSSLLLTAVAALTTGVVVGITWSNRKSSQRRPAPRRFGGAIRLRPEQYTTYRTLHDQVWPGVLRRMYQSNIRNFTIYYHKETNMMFSHYEWIGHWKRPMSKAEEEACLQRDLEAIAADPVTREWWTVCEPCQEPLGQWPKGSKPPSQGGEGDWWAPLECVNHCGYWAVRYGDQERDPDFVTMEEKERVVGTT